jgi:hypothetical protein
MICGEKGQTIIHRIPEKSLTRRAAKQFICFCFIIKDQGLQQQLYIAGNRKT